MRDSRFGSSRWVVMTMMALTGGVLFVAFLFEDAVLRRGSAPLGLVLRYVAAMIVGGALAGWLVAGLFGRRGLGGWLLALVGGAVATTVAGLIGSTVGLMPDLLADGWEMADLIPIGYGLAVLPLSFAGQPVLPVVWLGLIAVTHIWARRVRTAGG